MLPCPRKGRFSGRVAYSLRPGYRSNAHVDPHKKEPLRAQPYARISRIYVMMQSQDIKIQPFVFSGSQAAHPRTAKEDH